MIPNKKSKLIFEEDASADITPEQSDALGNLIRDKVAEKETPESDDVASEDIVTSPDADGNGISIDNESKFMTLIGQKPIQEDELADTLKSVFNGVKSGVENFGSAAKDSINNFGNAVKPTLETLKKADLEAGKAVRDAGGKVIDNLKPTLDTMKSGAAAMGTEAKDMINKGVDSAKDAAGNIVDNFKNMVDPNRNNHGSELGPNDLQDRTQYSQNTAQNDADAQLNSEYQGGDPYGSIKPDTAWNQFMKSDIAQKVIAASKDLKEKSTEFANDNPEVTKVAGGAAAALALYTLWRTFRHRNKRPINASVEPLVNESFQIIDYLKYDKTLQETKIGIFSSSHMVKKLDDNAKKIIAFAMSDKDFVKEINNGELIKEDTTDSIKSWFGKTGYDIGKGVSDVDKTLSDVKTDVTDIIKNKDEIKNQLSKGFLSGRDYENENFLQKKWLDFTHSDAYYTSQEKINNVSEYLNAHPEVTTTLGIGLAGIASYIMYKTFKSWLGNGNDSKVLKEDANLQEIPVDDVVEETPKIEDPSQCDENVAEFENSEICKDAMKYISNIKTMSSKNSLSATSEALLSSTASFIMWRAYTLWKESKDGQPKFQELQADIIKFGGLDPINETKKFIYNTKSIVSSPSRTLELKHIFEANLNNEILNYKKNTAKFMSRCLKKNETPEFIKKSFVNYIQNEISSEFFNEDEDGNIDVSSANFEVFKKLVGNAKSAVDTMEHDNSLPKPIRDKAAELGDKMDDSVKNLKTDKDSPIDVDGNDVPKLSATDIQDNIKNVKGVIDDLKKSGKNMNTVWNNVQTSIPEVKGKSYTQIESDFKNGKVSPVLMNKISQNLNSQK